MQHLRAARCTGSKSRGSPPTPLPTLGVLEEVAHRSPTTLYEKLIEIGGRMVHHARWVGCQLAEVAVLREQFAKTPRRIYGRSRSRHERRTLDDRTPAREV